ncbi:MAG: folylpolyglutamate synthase [Erysipelotrichaceae bacterium]|nr:MAG: folylpolyglutamate [Erysipelotrichaceae bacterium]TXT19814.1 MAG: folylpolyglutamate synthase [Erysipelotrichaceae bacterium]
MTFKKVGEFIAYSEARITKGSFGFEHFKAAMNELGNPQNDIKCVHIAGTNGKGSTTNYLRSILQGAGYKVGTFTSPHLIVHNDRIRINDVYISDEQLLEYGNRFYDFIEFHNLSMFEIDMLFASTYFKEQNVDFALYEVGLGGRLDATNIVTPLLSIITTIGFDHMELLGNTLKLIAGEKAGIIKPHVPLLTAEPKKSCLSVFETICTDKQAPIMKLSKITKLSSSTGLSYRYHNFVIHLNTMALYQIKNSATALEAALYLRELGYVISDEAIVEGLTNAQWKGRFEQVSDDPLIILDGAHNSHGIAALKESVKHLPKPIFVVFSALKDKETDKMISQMLDVTSHLIVTEFDFYRASTVDLLAKDFPVDKIKDPKKAIQDGIKRSKGGTLLITGSLYFISEVRQKILPQLLGETL